MLFTFFTFVGLFFTTRLSLILRDRLAGYDQRPPIKVVETNVSVLSLRKKYDLLKRLENEHLAEHSKLRLIYASHFLDDLNPYIIRAPNMSKGLQW